MSLTTQGILFLRPQANLLGGKQEDSPGLLKAWNPHTCVQGARISPQNKLRPEAQPCRRRLIGVRLQNKTPPWPPPSPAKKNLGIFFFFFSEQYSALPLLFPQETWRRKATVHCWAAQRTFRERAIPAVVPEEPRGAQQGKHTRLGRKVLGVAFPGPLPASRGPAVGGPTPTPQPAPAPGSSRLQCKPRLSDADFPFNTF